jgi:hypothetical protein
MSDKTHISRKDFFKLLGGAAGIGALSYFFGLRNQPNTIPAAALPAYLDGGSAFPVFRGPYLQKNAQLSALLFPADLSALTALCDQTLNAIPNSPFTYQPLISNVLVVCANMLVSSLDERDSGVGLIPESEIGFWLLTVASRRTATGLVPDHLAWFIPYLFVDEANSIATGREVYGFNKQAGAFAQTSQALTLSVTGFRRFGPDTVAQTEPLLEVTLPLDKSAQSQWNDWETAKTALVGSIRSGAGSGPDNGIVEFASHAALQNIPLAFIKQLRHAADPQKAAYQAVLETPMQIQSFHGGGFFAGRGEMKIQPLESHPLAQKLGLKENQASALGAWLNVDFVLGLGTEYSLTGD